MAAKTSKQGLKLADLDFDLPPELIAQDPAERRDASRMMVVDRSGSRISDQRFVDLPGILTAEDVLVLNNTKVFPARLSGITETGSAVEVFLVDDLGEDTWDVLARPAKRLAPGKRIEFGAELSATSTVRLANGMVRLRFSTDRDLNAVIDEIGRTPLPPYIKRAGHPDKDDGARYQTVYARERGAIAAPTAGLHFTPEIIEQIRQRGVTVAEITLHVGYGTFEPVRVQDLRDHKVLPERFEIGEIASDVLNTARSDGRRLVAVGTTTTRALESSLARNRSFTAGRHVADVTITPGFKFRAVDALLTNFHLPRSSLLILTSTFGGHELIMDAYSHAIAERYRFYSYGDCMLIV